MQFLHSFFFLLDAFVWFSFQKKLFSFTSSQILSFSVREADVFWYIKIKLNLLFFVPLSQVECFYDVSQSA